MYVLFGRYFFLHYLGSFRIYGHIIYGLEKMFVRVEVHICSPHDAGG